MSRAGFVLAGGRSSRMGRDKALLDLDGAHLVSRVAERVAAAAGSVMLIGDPEKYGGMGFAVCADLYKGCGPLAGVHAALSTSAAEWNLIVACDMPEVRPGFLGELLQQAERMDADCLLPAGESGRPEPLCAVYNRRALPAIERALESGIRKVLDGLAGLRLEILPVRNAKLFRNLNTPGDWLEYTSSQRDKTRREGK
jgi:molybdopterin-guanine dinucleotide biosynthesis protein A